MTESRSYMPALPEKTRVRLLKQESDRKGQLATVVWALPNPSKQAERQWYDVRFDDGVYGRFHERDLDLVEP